MISFTRENYSTIAINGKTLAISKPAIDKIDFNCLAPDQVLINPVAA